MTSLSNKANPSILDNILNELNEIGYLSGFEPFDQGFLGSLKSCYVKLFIRLEHYDSLPRLLYLVIFAI